jgi:ribosomal protein S18 acetylase RimI-like enzyme
VADPRHLIRRLVPRDAVEYRQLMLEAYERHPDAFTSSVSERAALPACWWEARLDDAPVAVDVVLGAFDDHRMVGAAGISFEKREKAKHKATLFGMYVPSQFRHRGIGHSLVRAVLAHARTRSGVLLVQLTVTQGNADAVSLYERCGFIPFGLEPLAVAVGSEFVAKIHMWCNLAHETGRVGRSAEPSSSIDL